MKEGSCAGRNVVIAGHGLSAMSSFLEFLTRRWTTVVAASRRNPWLTGFIVLLHVTAMVINVWTEWGPEHKTAFLLSWVVINCIWLALLRRPALAAALSFVLLITLIQLSMLKFKVLWLTVDFVDLMIIDHDTIAFLFAIFPGLGAIILGILAAAIPVAIGLWYFDPFRVGRMAAIVAGATSLVALVGLTVAIPSETYEGFYGNSFVSHFARTGVEAVSAFMKSGYMESAAAAADGDRLNLAEDACRPARKPPHIIMIHDESSFDLRRLPGVKVPADYGSYFKSFDGRAREFIVEGNGGPSWYTEYNVLAGLSARSFGRFSYFVTRIADGRVARGLPIALKRCGYNTYTIFPTLGAFMSASTFQRTVGVQMFIDSRAMGTTIAEPDEFYYEHAAGLIEREHANGPMFLYLFLAANHFPWDFRWRPDLTPEWEDFGNKPVVDEYLRRQLLTMKAFPEFLARLKREFPDESFLVVRYGDHQPDFSATMLDPALDEDGIAKRLIAHDLRYFTTYYAIDVINFDPVDLSSARDTLEGPHLPLIIQESAGVPLDPTFAEQKKILERCQGLFYDCSNGAEARRLNRLLIDAGLIKNL
jgi:phosphoglycerol transferase MdoB-like AlkP superfamily enzyme